MTTATTPLTVTLEQARALRLVRLGLAPQAPGAPVLNTPAEVVEHHLAMQGQEFGAAQWAVGSRLIHRGVTSAQILQAFDVGDLVRTWPMRGTVHVLAAPDARWLLDLCGPIALRGVTSRWQALGIDRDFADTIVRVAQEVLADGHRANRDELVAAFTQAGLDFTEPGRRYHAVWYACQTGTAVLGPTQDGDNLLALTQDHVPQARRLSTPQALTELGRRYLTARAPASVEDLQHWTKLTKTQVRQSLSAIGDDLISIEVTGGPGGAELFALAPQAEHAHQLRFGENVPRALVLAAFDEHLLGYRDRALTLHPDQATHVDPGRNGVFRHTVVLDGKVVGTWKRRLLKSTAPVDVVLFDRVKAAEQKLITRAFEPWGHFIGREPVVTFTT